MCLAPATTLKDSRANAFAKGGETKCEGWIREREQCLAETTLKDTKGMVAEGNNILDSWRGRSWWCCLDINPCSVAAEMAVLLVVIPLFDTVRVQLEQLAVRPNEKR